MLEIEPIEERDALTLLTSKLPFALKWENGNALIQALERIPLAIAMAAAYILECSPEKPISSYIQCLHAQDRLMSKQFRSKSHLTNEVPPTVLGTFQLSFEHLKRIKPKTSFVLSLFSMFDLEGIPHCLLHSKELCCYGEEIKLLTKFSLIQEDTERKLLRMHRSVQQISLQQLETSEALEDRRRLAINILANVFPSGEYDTFEDCQALVPHCKKLMQETASSGDSLVWIKAMERMGYYFWERGELWESEAVFQRALKGRKRLQDSPDFDLQGYIYCTWDLCGVQANQGRCKEVEPELRRILEIQERSFSEKHLTTIAIVDDLAWVLTAQNKSQEAQICYQRVVDYWKKHQHSQQFVGARNLARFGTALERLGKHEEAEVVLREAFAESVRLLGPKHPKALKCGIDLAGSINHQGKRKEAEVIWRQNLPQLENALGLDQFNVVIAANNFGLLLRSQGKYEEAEPYIRRAFVKLPKILGPRDLQTLAAVNNLALVLHNMSKNEEAETVIRPALKTYQETVGLQHPQARTSSRNLASILEKQKKYEEAEMILDQLLKDCEKTLGHNHPDTLVAEASLNSLRRRKR